MEIIDRNVKIVGRDIPLKRPGGRCFFIVAVIFMIICGCRLIQIVFWYQEADCLYNDIEKEVFVADVPAKNSKNQKEENGTGISPTVDSKKMISMNEDVVGWISIPELDLEYPITQGEDNEFYLHHTYNREENFAGSIFWIIGIRQTFKDQNTIRYSRGRISSIFAETLSWN